MVTDEQITQASQHLNNLLVTQWVNQQFLSPTWFFLVITLIISYALFIYLVDRERLIEILLFGSLVAVAFANYDTIGQQFGYWAYYKSILPLNPNLFLGDITLIPIYAMFVYQYTSSWRSFLIWNTVWAGLFSFVFYHIVLEYLKVFTYLKPFAVWLDFGLFLLFGIISRAIVIAFLKSEANRGRTSSKLSLSMLMNQPSSKSSIGKIKGDVI
ncbi:MAG: hypothetical protein VB084_11150 [Syntrophomonadaceae bacterium]|nr:hypothetical protein [Syntrophomonadaceae bacterium]